MARPRRDVNPLSDYAEAARSTAVQTLLREAARRKLTPTTFARLVGCDRKTLFAYCDTAKPRADTVERLAQALGYPKVVARALLDALTDRDIEAYGRKVFSLTARADIADLLTAPPDTRRTGMTRAARREMAAAVILAEAGLEAQHPIAAAEKVLAKYGVPSIVERVNSLRRTMPEPVLDCLAELQQVGAVPYDWVIENHALDVLRKYVGDVPD